MKKAWRWIVPAIALVAVIAAAAFFYPKLAVRYTPRTGDENTVEVIETAAPSAPVEESASPVSAPSEPPEETAPDFEVVNAEGSPVHLSDFAGQPVVVNFWASWCPPCRSELPAFDSLCAEYGDRVVFMMVNLTDGERETAPGAKAFVASEGYSFPVYYDTAFSAALAYEIYSIPVTVFVRPDGTLAGQQIGAMQESQLRAYIEELLKDT